MYAYSKDGYKESDDPMNTRGKYNTHRPRAGPQEETVDVKVAPEDAALALTPSRDFGPFFVELAPFRGVLTPIGHVANTTLGDKPVPGDWILIKGTVYGKESREGLPYAVLDVWQAGPSAEYDYQEKDGVFRPYLTYIGSFNNHSTSREYDYRARVLCNHRGDFEYQTVIPPPYLDPEDNTWRCPHVHHFIQADDHSSVVTQIMFPDMPKNDVDNHIRPELTVAVQRGGPTHWIANANFVLGRK